MTFVAAVTALSEKFLTERSFDLIVGPALADFEYDRDTTRTGRRFTRYRPVIAAVVGAAWDDTVRGGHLATFAGLSLIPLCYYSFWYLVWVPQGVRKVGIPFMTAVTLGILVLSLAPVIVCYWPTTDRRRDSSEQP